MKPATSGPPERRPEHPVGGDEPAASRGTIILLRMRRLVVGAPKQGGLNSHLYLETRYAVTTGCHCEGLSIGTS